MKRLLVALGALSLVSSNSFAAISVNSETDAGGWVTILGNYDYLSDQQTGQASGDIVGGVGGSYNAYDAGFFTNWDSAGSGTLGFRIRLDDHDGNQTPDYKGLVWVGVDADLDGGLDMFIGVNKAGNNASLSLRATGNLANTSPNTTSIVSGTAQYTYAITSSNYNYRAVTAADGGTSLDMTSSSTGDVDYYMTFTIGFDQITSFLASQGISGVTSATPLRYVLATSNQDNSLNQDLGGAPKNYDVNATWEILGAFSPAMTATGTVVPEPTAALLGGIGFLALFRRRRN